MFLIVAIVVLIFAPVPWNVIGFAAAFALFIGEVLFWQRTVRGQRAQAGAETLVGRRADVVTRCAPEGQVRLAGEAEIWRARCTAGAERGETVVIARVDGLTLVVEPTAPRAQG